MNTQHAPHVFLTGRPGCGKTTAIRRVLELLGSEDAAGFYTQELRQGGTRVGFQAVGLSGAPVTLAHVTFRTPQRVGKYGVDVAAFEEFLRAELGAATDEAALVVIDEVGKMECLSDRFVRRVNELLELGLPLLGTVAARGAGLISELKARPGIELVRVEPGKRGALPRELADRFRNLDRSH